MTMDILVIGGSGFIGRSIAAKLTREGHRITVPTRRRDRARTLFPLPTVTVEEADVSDGRTLERLMRGRDAVIFLVGILNEQRRGDFDRIHADLVAQVLAAAERARVGRYLHISALGANANAPSAYLRSKAAGEAHVRASRLAWTIFAPSVVFGAGDGFLNRFAGLTALLPPLAPMLLPAADAEFQPVWVDDVARAFVGALTAKESIGQSYPLVGPRRYRLRELVSYVMELQGDRHPILGLPDAATAALAALMQFVPTQPLTPDNVRSMRVPNVSDAAFPAFAGAPTALEDIAPGYIGPASRSDRARPLREKAHR